MAGALPAEQLAAAARALRYALAVMDEGDRQAAGGSPADARGVDMTVDDALALAPALALLLVTARRELASLRLVTDDPAELTRRAREMLEQQLEDMEVSATFAAVEAEVRGDG